MTFISIKNNLVNNSSQYALSWQRSLDSFAPQKDLISRVVGGSLSAVADVFIDTLKTPAQGLEHIKTAVKQLFYARTSGQGYSYKNFVWRNNFTSNIEDPSIHSVKGSLLYTEAAISQAIFTVPTTILAVAKLVHQLGGHFFYTDKTYSIGLRSERENSPPAWVHICRTGVEEDGKNLQDMLYKWTRSFTKQTETHKPDNVSPRLLSPFIAFADVVLDTLSPLAGTIETVCRTVAHLFGALTGHEDSSLRKVIVHTDLAFFKASQTASAVLMAVPKFLQKTCAILYDPEHAYSIRAFSSPENSETFNTREKTIQLRYV